MRFLLLARARSTGRIRLLSEHAVDTRSAAVDAAEVTAATMDLADDEVLAIDLDAADPVLVLRVRTSATDEAKVPIGTGQDRIAALAALTPAPVPPLRQQPRFPLFGAVEADTPAHEDVSSIPPLIAHVTGLEVGGLSRGLDRFEEDWDARTLDEYALPDDGALHAAREETHGRAESSTSQPSGQDAPDRADDQLAEPAEASSGAAWSLEDAWPAQGTWWEPHDTDDAPLELTPAESASDEPMPAESAPDDVMHHEFADADHEPAGPLSDSSLESDTEEAPRVGWEPPTGVYRPVDTDFAVWACADCAYQRTCRKAGSATPSTCGNFQWRMR